MANQINLLLMPTDQCNMRCKYCFHGDEGYCADVMDIDIFKRIIDVVSSKWNRIQIVWHGGEPLTVPLSFYREAYAYCNSQKNNFVFSIQTNATLLTYENILFFKENATRFGISYDGLTHDLVRGNGKIIRDNIALLNELDIYPGAILVVTKKNVHHLADEYEHFKGMNLSLKLNPMFVDGSAKYNNVGYALDVEEYCQSFIDFFKYWINDSNCNINVQTCYDYVKLIMGHHASVCSYNSCVGKWFCINYKGNIYPCDRLYDERFCFGNIMDYEDFEDVFENNTFKNLLKSSIQRREFCRRHCEIFDKCRGGCNASAHLGKGISCAQSDFCTIQKTIIRELTPLVIKATSEQRKTLNPKFISLRDKLIHDN